jgi:uncharacterized protein YfkK (UPF0435 family)
MELLTSQKMEYLLEASLQTLHTESLEWIQAIDFWREEMIFFYKLIHKKESMKGFPTKELAAIEKELIRISSDELEKIKTSVQRHERSLAAVLKTTSLRDEEGYREEHRKLLKDIYGIQALIRAFKKNVFSAFKKYE